MVTRADLDVKTLGPCEYDSPLADYLGSRRTNEYYVAEEDRILMDDTVALVSRHGDVAVEELPSFEPGGPRRRLFFDPAATRVGIVTCGGLCPGLNDVIRALTLELWDHYGVREILGFRNGFAGLVPGHDPIDLTPQFVASIAERGGTVLGSSRGAQDVDVMVDTLVDREVDILFVVGGDGSMRGAHALATTLERRGESIAVIGVPKTIDNDIAHIGTSFGFQTAFAKAAESIKAARVEAEASIGGVAVVKVMGRHAGFIACYAALANAEADFVLIPEVEFTLPTFLGQVKKRVAEKGSAVIVLAEGAGQHLIPASRRTDASGNQVLGDFAGFLRGQIARSFKDEGLPLALRYFDPGYVIRSVPADPVDAVYCTRLAHMAVHAGMSGRTDMVVGRRRHRFVHVPIDLVTSTTSRVDPTGDLWLSVLECTGQDLTTS